MLYTVTSNKSVQEIAQACPEVCARYKFGVLGSYDLQQKLRDKGLSFDRECQVLEICSPHHAQKVLEANIAIAAALPCRLAVYRQDGQTSISTLRPTALLSIFPNPELLPVAREVEDTIFRIIQELA